MSKKALFAGLLAIVAAGVAMPVYAGKGGPVVPPTIAPTVTSSGRNDTKFYAGINWNFGERNGATAFVGVRAAKVRPDNAVHGVKAEFGWVLSGAPMGPGEVHLKYLFGDRKTQAEVGVGYSIWGRAMLVNAGLQAPNVNAGADYLFGKGFLGYVGLNSLGNVRKPKTTESCPTGYTLGSGTCTQDVVD